MLYSIGELLAAHAHSYRPRDPYYTEGDYEQGSSRTSSSRRRAHASYSVGSGSPRPSRPPRFPRRINIAKILDSLRSFKLEQADRRLFPIFCIFLFFVALVLVRLFWFQVVKSSAYAEQAQVQRTRDITIPAKRGTIYDRQGNVLAKSVECKTIYANPSEIDAKNLSLLTNIVSDTLNLEKAEVLDKLSKHDKTFVYIEHKIDNKLADELSQNLEEAGIQGCIYKLKDQKRVYPYGAIGGEVIGSVNRDGDGLTGLEKYYDTLLKGTDGELLIQRGRLGQPIAGGIEKDLPAQDGTDIIVSIDIEIQQQAEKSVAETVEKWSADSGSAVVMSPKTGEILAACSTPFYDPSDLANASPDSLNLRPVTDAYEPGSTFKPLTAAMALNEGVSSPEKGYTVPPSLKVGTHDVRDIFEHGTIGMSLREILMQSSNIGITLVQREVGVNTFRNYLKKLHFGERSGIDFGGESAGIIASDENWGSANAGFNSFGQGISVTPIQISRAMSAIANGGLLRVPHFLVAKNGERVLYPEPERVFSDAASDQVADMMKSVVSEGTGKNGRIEGYSISGKTGTAQRANPNGKGYLKNSNTANFIGFGPTEDPALLVYVVVDGTPDGFGGTTAGPAFRDIMKVALKRLNIAPSDLKAFNQADEIERAQERQEEETRERLIERKQEAESGESSAKKKQESSKKSSTGSTKKRARN